MTVTLPPGYPELLGTLAAALEAELGALLPDLVEPDRGHMAVQLTEQCRNTIGGLRVPALPRVEAIELRTSDLTYELLASVWEESIATARPGLPEPWRQVALARLLDRLRGVVGGFTVPKGRALLALRNDRMFRSFRGDFQALAATFGVCAERARQIITAKLKAEREARQQSLFGPPSD